MRISPRYTVADWNALTLTESDWGKAIDIFEDRIRGRFLNIIQGFSRRKFAGFAVLALDCLLIETLQQFREGVASTPSRKGKPYFVRFLTETAFKREFDKKKAELFYDQFRNGILHQAEVKGPSLVRVNTRKLVAFTKNEGGLILNRMLFHRKLVQVFDEYTDAIRGSQDRSLRASFRKKMNSICKIKEVG